MAMRRNVVFLDRDDVINKGRHHTSGDARNYVTKWEEFEWIAGSKEAIIRLLENDYFVVVVSNQGCIGKKILSEEMAEIIQEHMEMSIRCSFTTLHDYEYADNFKQLVCPHTPEDLCSCRKPKPGMLYAAAYEWSIDLHSAWMVGDGTEDMVAGWNAGIRKLIRIDTSKQPYCFGPMSTAQGSGIGIPNLLNAVNYILERDGVELDDHLEVIWCPECRKVQIASAEHTLPFTYVHKCVQCEYVITGSEWNQTTTGEAPIEEDVG